MLMETLQDKGASTSSRQDDQGDRRGHEGVAETRFRKVLSRERFLIRVQRGCNRGRSWDDGKQNSTDYWRGTAAKVAASS